MNFQAHLKNMLEMMEQEFLVLFGGGLLIQFFCSVTLGILSGPLMAGYLLLMLQWLKTGRKCQFNDLFSGMTRFAELFPVFFLLLLILFGYMLLLVPGVVMTVWWIYVLFLMADKGCSLAEAMNASKEKVLEGGFWMHLVFLLMISVIPTFVISVLAAVIPPLAVLHYLLFPLQCACLASLYLEQFEGFDPETRTIRSADIGEIQPPPPPPVAPPPCPE